MKSNNYLVTFEELSTMGFPVKAGVTPPMTNKAVTKGEVNTYYTVDVNASPFSTYTNDRCPRYQDLVPVPCLDFVPVVTQTTVSTSNGQVINPDCVNEFVYKFQISAGAGVQQSGGVVRLNNYLPAGIQATSFRYIYYDGKAIGPGANDWPLPTSDYYEVVTFTSGHVDFALKKPIGNGHTYTVAFNAKVTGGGNTYTNIASLTGLGCSGLVQVDSSNTFTITPTNVAIAVTTDNISQSNCGTVKRYKIDVTNSGCEIVGGTLSVTLPNGLYLDAFEAILYDDQLCPVPTSDYYTLDTYEQSTYPTTLISPAHISVTLKKSIGSGLNYSLYFYAYTTSTTTQDYTISANYTNGSHIRNQSHTSSYTGYPTSVYYELSGCTTAGYAYTLIQPLGVNNRYVLPSTGAVYTATGVSVTQCTAPPLLNTSIQRTTSYNCQDAPPPPPPTYDPITFDLSYNCTSNGISNITATNIAGGTGSYQASVTPQTSQYNAVSGSFSSVSGSRTWYDNQNGTWYVAIRDANDNSRVTIKNTPNIYCCPNTSPNWQWNGSYNCYGTCNEYKVEQDVNGCSGTSGQTRQGALVASNTTDCGGCCGQGPCCGQSTAQTAGTNPIGNVYTCSNGTVNSSPVYQNTNTCYLGPNIYLYNGTWQSSNPSNAYPSTASNCQDTGSAFCQGPNWVINQYQANNCSSASCGVRVIEYNSVSHGCYTPPSSCTSYRMENYNGYGLTDYVEWTDCNNNMHSEWVSDGSWVDICSKDGTQLVYTYSTPVSMGTC